MFGKMKQMMDFKKQADRIKKELDVCSVEIADVKGIKIKINGSQNFQSIEIDESVINSGNKKRLESDLLKSMNTAIKKSQMMAAKKMQAVMPGFPGM